MLVKASKLCTLNIFLLYFQTFTHFFWNMKLNLFAAIHFSIIKQRKLKIDFIGFQAENFYIWCQQNLILIWQLNQDFENINRVLILYALDVFECSNRNYSYLGIGQVDNITHWKNSSIYLYVNINFMVMIMIMVMLKLKHQFTYFHLLSLIWWLNSKCLHENCIKRLCI